VMLEMMRRFLEDYQEAKASGKPVGKIAEAATFAVGVLCEFERLGSYQDSVDLLN
jgi:hypothetical protein